MDTTEAAEAPAPEMQEPAPIANRFIVLRWFCSSSSSYCIMNAKSMARCTCKARIDQTLGPFCFTIFMLAFSMAALLHVDL